MLPRRPGYIVEPGFVCLAFLGLFFLAFAADFWAANAPLEPMGGGEDHTRAERGEGRRDDELLHHAVS